ncbi:hypothetical protein [Haloarcula sp. Atlit-120R]|uniref:hypothetical protein n=1 Tax=Haloarcula sp. Atlit-120R TaxID=2282135 RepID=UPI001F3E4076|nr:hypothetical protein [Haloarcula sp. Atlit-120R]
MTNLLLQAGIDLSTGGVTAAQMAFAVGLLVLFGAALVAGSYLLQFSGLPEEQTRQKKALLGQREAIEATTLRLHADDDLDAMGDEIRALFDGDGPDVEEASLRTAVGAVRQELGDAWGSYATAIPRLARWLLELAVGLSVTAALVHVSVATYRDIFAGGDGVSVDELWLDTQWAVGEFVSLTVDAFGAFPYADFIWALTFAYGVQAASWVYDHPLAVIALLLASAVAVILLDRRAPEARDISVTSRLSIWTVVVGAVGVWLAGAVPAALGSLAGIPRVGALVGLVSAAGVALVFGYLIGRSVVRDTRALVRAHNDPDRETVAYLVARRLGVTAAAVAAPLIPVYLIAAVATGQLSGIVGAFLAGSVAVQAAGGLLVLLVLVVGAWVTRGAVPDLRAALGNLAADTSVRLAVFRRGVPIVAMVTVYFLALGFGLPWFVAGVFALVAGVGTRGAYYLFRRIRYRATEMESPERTPSQVQVRAYRLSTADGERYYASVNSHELAHEDADTLTDAVCRVAGSVFEGDSPGPSVEHAFAEDLLRFGIVDVDETERKLEKTAEEEAEGKMRSKHGRYPAEKLEERITRRVPEHIWREVKHEKRLRGEWTKRDGHLVLRG